MYTPQFSELMPGGELHKKLLEPMQSIQGITNRAHTKDGTLLETNTLDLCFRGQRQAERKLLSGMERLHFKLFQHSGVKSAAFREGVLLRRDDKAFNKLQNAFDHMMSGGFH